jgi:hypothetical protein
MIMIARQPTGKKTAYSLLSGLLFLVIGVLLFLTDRSTLLESQHPLRPAPYAIYILIRPEAWMYPEADDLLENKDPAWAEAAVNRQWEKWHSFSPLDYRLVIHRSAPFSHTIHEVTVTYQNNIHRVYQIDDCELLSGQSYCAFALIDDGAYSVDGLFKLLLDLIQTSTEQSCLWVYFDELYGFPAFISYKNDCEQVFDAGVLWYITYFKIP